MSFCVAQGNPHCRQIPWGRDAELIEAWKFGRTGYPFIDAIMTQLRVEGNLRMDCILSFLIIFYFIKICVFLLLLGWIHHLARHAVACFLTRGDLYQHWEEVCIHNKS